MSIETRQRGTVGVNEEFFYTINFTISGFKSVLYKPSTTFETKT